MSDTREALQAELVEVIQLGKNSKKLLETQKKILSKIKDKIIEELAMVSAVKEVSVTKFLWFTIRTETRSDLQRIEALQADLRVIIGYESLLEGSQNEANVAKMNLESLNSQV